MAARPPALSPESTISHEGPFCRYVVSFTMFLFGCAEQD